MKKKRASKILFTLVRIAVAAGLLAFVFTRVIHPRELVDRFRGVDPRLLGLGVGLEVLPIILTTWRWQLLLRPVGLELSFGRVLHYNYIGLFFNNFLLGLTGGDVVKAILVSRGSDRKAGAILTVFVDRLVGLVMLAAIAAAACATKLSNPEFRQAAAIVYGFLGAFAAFCLVYFNRRLRTLQFVRRLRRALPGRRILYELDAAGRAYRGHAGAVAVAAALSVAGHWCSLIAAFVFARALGAQVSLQEILIYVPVVMMIASVPVSVGTWGVGEAAFIAFFRKIGMSDATAVGLSLLVRLGQMLPTLPGGLLLALPTERKAVQEAEREAEEEAPARDEEG